MVLKPLFRLPLTLAILEKVYVGMLHLSDGTVDSIMEMRTAATSTSHTNEIRSATN